MSKEEQDKVFPLLSAQLEGKFNPQDFHKADMIVVGDPDQCIEKIVAMVRSAQFEENEQSRDKLRDVAITHHVRAALRMHVSTSHCYVKVTALYGRVTLEGVVEESTQRAACAEIAARIKGVMDVDNRLRTADMPTRRGTSI